VTGDRVDVLKELDFGRGDTLVFNKYESGTFRDKSGGNIVHNDKAGTYVKIDSAVDLAELVARSSGISAEVDSGSDTLIFRIDQKGGSHEVVMEGMGEAYREAYQPDLF
jgi:hypothetical protein